MSQIDLSTATLDDIILATIGDGTTPQPAPIVTVDDAIPMVLAPDAKTLELSIPELEAAHELAERRERGGK